MVKVREEALLEASQEIGSSHMRKKYYYYLLGSKAEAQKKAQALRGVGHKVRVTHVKDGWKVSLVGKRMR